MSADPWETTTGLMDDFDYLIEQAWFGTNDKFGEGKRMLLTFRGTATTTEGEVEEDYELIYTLGDGWEAIKGGDAVKHRAGNPQFSNSSAIGRLIDSLKAIPGAVDALREKGMPTEAETWVGLNIHLKRQDFGSFTPEGQTEPRRISTPVATALLNGGAAAPAKPARGRKAAAATEDADEAKPARRTRKPKTKDLRAEVVEFASEFDDHADFVTAVFDEAEFPRAAELEDDEELSEDVLDEEGSVWSDSRE